MRLKSILILLVAPALFAGCGGSAPEPDKKAPEAEEEASAAEVKLSPEQLKAAGIGLETVGPAQIREVLPLYGAMPPDEQDRVLQPSSRRRVIVATNIAETSLACHTAGANFRIRYFTSVSGRFICSLAWLVWAAWAIIWSSA